MGPGNSSNLPSRPKFSWDIRSTPWTDGRGNQEGFARAVKLWGQFHDKLPASNSNKIPADLRGICLKSQLFGRALDLCKGIPDDDIASENGAQLIIDAIYKRDALSVVSEVYQDFNDLLTCRRSSNESFKNYESRFAAMVAKMSAHGNTVKLHESLLAMMLLTNANIDDAQRVPILAAAGGRKDVDQSQTNDAIIKTVMYESVASVLRQCDNGSGTHSSASDGSSTFKSNGATFGGRNGKKRRSQQGKNDKQRLTPDQLRDLKSKQQCRSCGFYGHWSSDHKADGSLKDGVTSRPPPVNPTAANAPPPANTQEDTQHGVNAGKQRRTPNDNALRFDMAFLSDEKVQYDFLTASNVSSGGDVGPLVDDGAPYSAIGTTELCLLRSCDDVNSYPVGKIPDQSLKFSLVAVRCRCTC